MLIKLAQIGLKVLPMHERLEGVPKERNNLGMKAIFGRKHGIKREIVKLRQIDLVSRLCVPRQFSGQHQIEKC